MVTKWWVCSAGRPGNIMRWAWDIIMLRASQRAVTTLFHYLVEMGGIFSRKPQKSSKAILEVLEKEIHSKTQSRRKNQQYERNFISYLLLISFALYLVGLFALYVYFVPSTWGEWLGYLLLALLFPLVVYLIKKLLNWYFSHRKAQFDQELATLQEDKRKVLNEVMEKETYKIAVELLQRYEPTHPALKNGGNTTKQDVSTEHAQSSPMHRRSVLRRRDVPTHPSQLHRTPAHHHPPPPVTSTPAHPTLNNIPPVSATPTTPAATPSAAAAVSPPPPITPTNKPPDNTFISEDHAKQQPFIPPGMCLGAPPGPPTPCPILPRSRSSVDKVVEYLVGDGPNNRYALICQQCHSHNGMALRDEFEYMTFRCAYCYHVNQSHKKKPSLQRLPTQESEHSIKADANTRRRKRAEVLDYNIAEGEMSTDSSQHTHTPKL